ncbi:MAG: N(5)-(carboxyethyl)ornithine synthase [Candidatus Saccharicenans sp.]|jgi:alanine dehydrogenase|nr:N(5)-(carboxyethyl)ornithine synthase [Candidatus Saccharicenans sp.]MDH7575624.1 N(5)-(carboxyethyl)ornithine synthase [Candidatus Saccharicenans sp.]
MKIGVIGKSLKENERRVPILPEHLSRIPENLLYSITFEKGYGFNFGYDDEYFIKFGSRIASREEIFNSSDLIILPKPLPQDLRQMKPHQILFGWAHCVQQRDITQAAIEQHLTIIAWESMHAWSRTGEKKMHIFYKNNELAGYAAIIHCLQILGIDGFYGPRRKVVILSYGSVSRGAIYALHGRGFNNIYVYSRRPPHLIGDQNPDVYYGQYYFNSNGDIIIRTSEGVEKPLIAELSDADIICNGILQDVKNPIIFINNEQVYNLKPGSIIVDISCDLGMGFSFARPTTFENPVFKIGNNITYYSVDHTPSYLWNAASREISKALLPFLEIVAAGPETWAKEPTIYNAIEIQDGYIKNPDILTFQNREKEYPHKIIMNNS